MATFAKKRPSTVHKLELADHFARRRVTWQQVAAKDRVGYWLYLQELREPNLLVHGNRAGEVSDFFVRNHVPFSHLVVNNTTKTKTSRESHVWKYI